MLRATRMLLSPIAKKSTGIVGLDVVPNAREVLVQLYEKTLSDIKVRGSACHRGERMRGGTSLAHRPCARASSRAHLSHPRSTAARPLQIIPEAVEYRKAVEKFTSYRLNVVKTTLEVRRDTCLFFVV
jgi:hypothetical protein